MNCPPAALVDPYRLPPGGSGDEGPRGRWVKGQLHVHTTRSDGRLQPEEAVRAYAEQGFDFVCITDHDRVLQAPPRFVDGCLVLPGEESTLPRPFRPFGPHLLRLFVQRPVPRRLSLGARLQATVAEGGLAVACHPAWPGNLGTGRWVPEALLDPRIALVEIVNHHAPVSESVRIWDEALVRRGAARPLWGVAVDDSHRPEQIGRAWVVVRIPAPPDPPEQVPANTPSAAGKSGDGWGAFRSSQQAADAVRRALAAGTFYASTGAEAEFAALDPPAVRVRSRLAATIRFLGPGLRLLQASQGREATYRLQGDEAFVRVEVEYPDGRAAWSQPFWLLPAGPA